MKQAEKKRRLASSKGDRVPAYIALYLWLFFTVVLLGWIMAASLSTSAEIYKGEVLQFASGLHFENYVTAWKSQNVSVMFMNSLIYAVTGCVGVIAISAPAAYVLARFNFKGNKLIRICLIIAMSVPMIMVILPIFSTTTHLGINRTRGLLIALYIFSNVPFATTFLTNSFASLSKSYEEAAAIDGCTPTMTFWRIMLPLAQPGIITVSIFLFLSIWNEYFMAMVFAGSDRLISVGAGLMSMVSAMRQTGQMGPLFAAVVVVFLPTFILYIFLSEKIIAGVTGGGVKG